jgi:hypothetical protein
MKDLSNTIIATYTARFDELDAAHQFHWLSRLRQWQNIANSAVFTDVISRDQPANEAAAREILATALASQPDPQIVNHYNLRQKYFGAYPSLFGTHQALFQVRHWLFHGDLDARDTLKQLLDAVVLDDLLNKLRVDEAALAALSTYAVNTLYLAKQLLQQDETFFLGSALATKVAPLSLPTLFCYFVTHCVIADTLFYAHPVPEQHRDEYQKMLAMVEGLLGPETELSLDAQLEFVVAGRLCGYESPQAAGIIANAEQHFDSQLGYITDPSKPNKNTLNAAEHRNVLYVMATTASPKLAVI